MIDWKNLRCSRSLLRFSPEGEAVLLHLIFLSGYSDGHFAPIPFGTSSKNRSRTDRLPSRRFLRPVVHADAHGYSGRLILWERRQMGCFAQKRRDWLVQWLVLSDIPPFHPVSCRHRFFGYSDHLGCKHPFHLIHPDCIMDGGCDDGYRPVFRLFLWILCEKSHKEFFV